MAIGRTISYLGMPFPNGKNVKNLSNGHGARQGIPPAGRSMGCPIMITQAIRTAMVYINYIVAALTNSKDQSVRIKISYFSYIATTILVISDALSCY